jgi:hypothetical protein
VNITPIMMKIVECGAYSTPTLDRAMRLAVGPAKMGPNKTQRKEINVSKKRSNTPWIEERFGTKKFSLGSCKNAAAYLKHRTGIDFQIHKTQSYLVLTYVKGGSLAVEKIPLPGEVLYCLKESDFDGIVQKVKE